MGIVGNDRFEHGFVQLGARVVNEPLYDDFCSRISCRSGMCCVHLLVLAERDGRSGTLHQLRSLKGRQASNHLLY